MLSTAVAVIAPFRYSTKHKLVECFSVSDHALLVEEVVVLFVKNEVSSRKTKRLYDDELKMCFSKSFDCIHVLFSGCFTVADPCLLGILIDARYGI